MTEEDRKQQPAMSTSLPTPTRTDYTEGSITRAIFAMGLPSMFGFLAQHIYALADMFWVSRLESGEPAVAAITFFNNIVFLVYAFNSIIGPGSVALISRRYGEGKFDEAERAIKESVVLKLFFGVVTGLAAWILLPVILPVLGAEPDVARLGVTYGRVYLVGLPLMFAAYTVFTAMRCVANPGLSMALMIGSNVMNLTLDPLFIFGYLGLPEMGIAGAAVASVISFSLTFIVGAILLNRGATNVRVRPFGGLPVQIQSMRKMIVLGVPVFLGDLIFSGSRLLITPVIAAFGTPVVAAFGIGMQVVNFGIHLLVGMGMGVSSLIGHNLGANKHERARATADRLLQINAGIMIVFGVGTALLARQFVGLFFSDPVTITEATVLLRILAVGFPFFGVYIALEQIHMGVGLNTPYMVMAAIHAWLFQVAPIWLLVEWLQGSQSSVWWVLAVSAVLTSGLFYLYYRRGRWLTVSV